MWSRIWLVDPDSQTSPAASHWSTGICFALFRLPPLRVFINKPHFISPAVVAAPRRPPASPPASSHFGSRFQPETAEELWKATPDSKGERRGENELRCNNEEGVGRLAVLSLSESTSAWPTVGPSRPAHDPLSLDGFQLSLISVRRVEREELSTGESTGHAEDFLQCASELL